MRRRSMVTICVLLCVWFFTITGYTEVEQKNRLVQAESIAQLIDLIKSAIQGKDSKGLEQIKSMNTILVKNNKVSAIKECSNILNDAIEKEFSGQFEVSKEDFQISQILAEIYKDTEKSTYLFDKVCKFRKWNRNEKEKCVEANNLSKKGYECFLNYKFNDALNFYDKSKNIYQEIQYEEGEARCFSLIGDAYNMLDEYDKAEQMYKKSLILLLKIKNPLEEANCIQGLGELNEMLGEYDKAILLYNDSLAINREINNRLGVANCLFFIGSVNKKLSKFDEAIRFYNESLMIYREIKARWGEAYCIMDIGAAYGCLDKYEKASQCYEEALIIFREVNYQIGVADCKKRLGDYYALLHEHEKALKMFKEALIFSREIKSRSSESTCLISLGDTYKYLEEYDKANKCYEESLEINRELKSRSSEAICLKKLGESCLMLQKYEKARQLVEESLAICRELKERYGEAYCLFFLGDLHRHLSEYDKSSQRFEESLMIFREIKNRTGEANCLQHLGDVYRLKFDFKKALQYLEEGLAIFRDLSAHLGEANCIQGIGNVYWSLSDYKNAIDRHEKALSIQTEIRNRLGMLWSYYSLGQIFEAIKKYTEAEKNYKKSIQVIEDVWQQMKFEEYKAQYFISKISPYESLISLLFKRRDGASAFPYAERSKARSFLYLLGNKRVDASIGVPPELAKEENELRQKINSLTMRILDNEEREVNKRVATEKWNDQLLELKQKHSEVLEKIKLNSPEYASMLTVNPLSIDEIQSLIREDGNMVLIEYYTTPDNLFMWLLDGKKILPYRIDVNLKTLDAKIQEFNSMISNNTVGITTISTRAQRLYNLLLKPVEKYLDGKSRIAIVPHGSLHYLPFEALMNKGKFLVEKNIKLFYLPSASVYKYCKEKNQHRKEKATAFVNPDGTLPCSEKEAEDLKQLFPGNVAVFSGKDVTESLVKANSGSSDILHFACHGKFESEHPMYSALLFGPDTENDGRLEVSEIFQLQLKPAYLVTLSACETNVGNISPGDEIVGLTRAFIYAGTPSILASLWKVDDQNTEKFMASFYRALRTSDKVDALHAARMEMMNEPGKRHPFNWAAFVLIGDYR